MLKRAMMAVFATGLTATGLADLPGDFGAALGLYHKKEYRQAHEALLKVADIAPTRKSKAQSLAYAALSLSRLKRYEQALELARKIEDQPVSVNCQMEVMLEHRKFKELIEAFKDENLSAWPDHIIHRGFYNRGTAYRRAGRNGQAAARDLEKAVEHSDTTGHFQERALNELGALYQALKDDAKALAAHRRVLAAGSKGLYTHYGSGISAAGILLAQGKYGEALTELQKLDPLPPSGTWRFRTLEMRGDAYAGQGKKNEAIAKYREATQMKGMSQRYLDRVSSKLGKLTGEQSQ